MKPARLSRHLQTEYKEHINKSDMTFFYTARFLGERGFP